MTKTQIVDAFIIRYNAEHLKLPEMYKICEGTGLNAVAVSNILIKTRDYPKRLMITPKEKELIDIWRTGMTQMEAAEVLGVDGEGLRHVFNSCIKKNLIDYTKKKYKVCGVIEDADDVEYVEVVCGLLKGGRGYRNPNTANEYIIFKDGQEYGTNKPLIMYEEDVRIIHTKKSELKRKARALRGL